MTDNDKVVNQPEDIEDFRTEKGKNSFNFTGVTFKCEMDFPGFFSRKNQVAIYPKISINKIYV